MRIAVYTCITGGYDLLRSPRHVDHRIDYWCFSDQPNATQAPWQTVPLPLHSLGARDVSRFVKMHPHRLPEIRDYDLTIYLDGSIEIVGSLYELARECANRTGDIFLYDHPFRDCIYDEAAACAYFGHGTLPNLAAQMRRYRRAGYPGHAGLSECGVLVRRNSQLVDRLMEVWWEEYRRGTPRDQLSLGFVAWRQGFSLQSLGPSDPRFVHRFFQFHPHPPRPRQLAPFLRRRMNLALMAVLPSRVWFGRDAADRS